jgi:hypothetical protein
VSAGERGIGERERDSRKRRNGILNESLKQFIKICFQDSTYIAVEPAQYTGHSLTLRHLLVHNTCPFNIFLLCGLM